MISSVSYILVMLEAVILKEFPNVVIAPLDAGPRYQLIPDAEGVPHLVDLWLKTSDVEASKIYFPERDNFYYLFTRANTSTGQHIPIGDERALNSSNFDPSKKTVILVHGWLNTRNSAFNVFLTNAYLIAEDVNIFVVDWSNGAGTEYLVAILNCIKSGSHVVEFIKWVNSLSGAKVSQYHVIGHSLGAHQAGIIGRGLDKQVPYMTALDPALPGWAINPYKFTPDVALYTEMIHTDVGVLGTLLPAGLVDFYPNGGWAMPGCSFSSICNHHRSILYLGESLIRGGFIGQWCQSIWQALTGSCEGDRHTLKMGGLNPKNGTGIYYLKTNAFPPFSVD